MLSSKSFRSLAPIRMQYFGWANLRGEADLRGGQGSIKNHNPNTNNNHNPDHNTAINNFQACHDN